MRTRSGENAKPWFRTDRYYHTNDGWWFLTREKLEKGPFSSQVEAKNELAVYIREMSQMNSYSSL